MTLTRTSLVLASRKSLLARIQSSMVAKQIHKIKPDLKLHFSLKQTTMDQEMQKPLWETEIKGAFTHDLSKLLVEKEVDAVVHSYKDLPLENYDPGIKVIPVLPRADQRDLLLFKKSAIQQPPKEIHILTSSLRRMYLLDNFLRKALPKNLQSRHLHFNVVRGSIPTRLRKLMWSTNHGLVLAKAALDRLLCHPKSLLLVSQLLTTEEIQLAQKQIRNVLANCEFMVLPLSCCPNAPAQGSLAVEVRESDSFVVQLFTALIDAKNESSSRLERQGMRQLGGGCHQKIGITVLERDYGRIYYLRGVKNNEGKETLLVKQGLERPTQQSTKIGANVHKQNHETRLDKKWQMKSIQTSPANKRALWPLPEEKLKIKRTPLKVASDAIPSHIWVSRYEAWPSTWEAKGQILWAAGTKTLFRLADRGFWVHGCADSLGEQEDTQIEVILNTSPSFVKLTHHLQKGLSRFASLATYKVEISAENTSRVKECRHFFWKSALQFNFMTRLYPEILHANHASGPGLTFQHIQQKLSKPVEIFLNYEDWLKVKVGIYAQEDSNPRPLDS